MARVAGIPRLALAAAAVAALVAVASARPPSASAWARCSLMVFGGTRPSLYFIGRATPDTALAGGGDVREDGPFRESGRRLAEGMSRSVHGQVVRVGRVGGAEGERLERALRDERREVLLVPWAYGPDCATSPWEGSVRWVTPDSVGLFGGASLRPESLWVDHRPTLDVFAAWYEPYPHGSSLRFERSRAAREGISTWLTADELFGLYEALPEREALEHDAVAAIAGVEAWHVAHPELAERAPAAGMLRGVYGIADGWPAARRVRELSPPVAGTYQLAVAFAGGEAQTLFVRLEGRSRRPILSAAPDPSRPGRQVVTAVGYELHALGARTVEALPRSIGRSRPQPCDVMVVAVSIEPERTADGATAWRGDIDPGALMRCLPGDAAIPEVQRRLGERWRERYEAAGRAGPPPRMLSAVFRLDRGGELTLEQRIEHGGEPLVVVRGRRVSTEALAVPW